MLVTIIGSENGVGLSKDKHLLTAILQENGINVDFRSVAWYKPLHPDCDICIHTEVVVPHYFGKKNILIPNQEWFYKKWLIHLKKFDAVFCKTHYATEIFNKYHDRVVYTGFTSLDYFQEGPKRIECFHSQGKSRVKGTRFLIETWNKEELPPLNLITSKYKYPLHNSGIKIYDRFLPTKRFKTLMNQSLIHIYPCEIEGFGHCINESKSCGAVVITTDHPPMNELVSDFVIPVYKKREFSSFLGHTVTVRTSHISKVIRELLERNDLFELGLKNRESYLQNDLLFRGRLLSALDQVWQN
jgi:glycosyltransferase involved in cell wall biosynthesis